MSDKMWKDYHYGILDQFAGAAIPVSACLSSSGGL